MTALTDTSGRVLPLTLADSRILDDFKQPNGAIGNGWLDLATLWPDRYDSAIIESESFACKPATLNTAEGGGAGNLIIGHWTIARPFPLTDNFQVSINYTYEGLSQISPCAFVAPTTNDPLQVGYKWVDDSGLATRPTYAQNVFRTAGPGVADCLDPGLYYRPDNLSIAQRRDVFRSTESVTMRVVGGRTSLVWNGQRRGPVTGVAIPAYCYDGRPNMVGIDIIGIQIAPGRDIPPWGVWGNPVYERIVGFAAGPYNGPL